MNNKFMILCTVVYINIGLYVAFLFPIFNEVVIPLALGWVSVSVENLRIPNLIYVVSIVICLFYVIYRLLTKQSKSIELAIICNISLALIHFGISMIGWVFLSKYTQSISKAELALLQADPDYQEMVGIYAMLIGTGIVFTLMSILLFFLNDDK